MSAPGASARGAGLAKARAPKAYEPLKEGSTVYARNLIKYTPKDIEVTFAEENDPLIVRVIVDANTLKVESLKPGGHGCHVVSTNDVYLPV